MCVPECSISVIMPEAPLRGPWCSGGTCRGVGGAGRKVARPVRGVDGHAEEARLFQVVDPVRHAGRSARDAVMSMVPGSRLSAAERPFGLFQDLASGRCPGRPRRGSGRNASRLSDLGLRHVHGRVAAAAQGKAAAGGAIGAIDQGASIAATSAGVWKRNSGNFAIIRTRMDSSSSGTSGRNSPTGAGSRFWCHRSFCATEPSPKGVRPVSRK